MPFRTESFLSDGLPIRLFCAEPEHHPLAPALVFLHGAGGNTGFWTERMAPLVTGLGVSLFAVHYFDRTGTVRADAGTLADPQNPRLWLETLTEGLRVIAARPAVDPSRIALAGVSLGAFLSLALATQRPAPSPRCLVSISGGLVEPYKSAVTATFPPTLIVHGTADTVVPATNATELGKVLLGAGVPHRTELVTGEGHWFSPAAQPRVLAAIASFLREYL